MSRKNQQDRRIIMGLSGAVSTNWAMVGQAILKKGGAPEDLGILGEPENPATIKMVDNLATELVALGNETRANREKAKPILVPPQFAFRCALQPLHLFVLNKSGADATTLLSRLDGTYLVTDYGEGMMRAPEFAIGPVETALVGVFTCEQLGVAGWLETDFFGPKGWKHIKQFGLTKCLPDDGPYVRLADQKQGFGEWFRMAHDPISFGGDSHVWDVGHINDYGRCLVGWNLSPDDRPLPGVRVALRLAY